MIPFRTLRGRSPSRERSRPLHIAARSFPLSSCLRNDSASTSRRAALSWFMGACNLANSAIRSASWSFPSLLKSMMYDGFRVAVNCPHLNEGPERRRVDVHDDFSARAAFNRQGVSTEHPPRFRSGILPARKRPLDGRRLIFATPPQLNRRLRGRSSSPLVCSDMSIRSSAER